jgi:hypothetical protein
MFALRAEIVTIFGPKMLTISARTVIQTYTKFSNFARLYLSYFTTFRNHIFCNFTNFNEFVMGRIYFFCLNQKLVRHASCLLEEFISVKREQEYLSQS